MTVAENKLHPLQIEDARASAYTASEMQKKVEDEIRAHSRALAEAERAYRRRLSERIVELKAAGNAITACETIAKGEKDVADLRYRRDVARGIFEAAQQQSFRRGADRRDINVMLTWSMHRDLRTDTSPPGFDPATGEIKASRHG